MLEAYSVLKARILYQAILDYVQSKAKLEGLKGKSITKWESRNVYENRLKDCESFFKDPPYDYGDVDMPGVKGLCDWILTTDRRVVWDDTRC